MYDNRRFIVLPFDKIHLVDFSQVQETSSETCRRSVDGNLTFVKYDGDMPSSIAVIEGISKEYTYEEFMEELKSSTWVSERENVGSL